MNKKKRILIALCIIFTMVISFFVGNTFSKYLSEVKGTGTAEIANWVFKVNGTDEVVRNVNLLSTYNNETLVDKRVAPGTNGFFNIVIDAGDSEVGVDYVVEFLNESKKPQNLVFTYEGVEYNSIQDLEENLSGTINANDEDRTREISIYWDWKYETGDNENEINENDIIDTNDAKELENYTFDVLVRGTQVMPK